MSRLTNFSPVTRISGLLGVDLYVDENGKVIEAYVRGEQYRGFTAMLRGREITDAVYFTQRICGICSMAHGFTAARLVGKIYGAKLTSEALLLQQVMLASEFLQNHIRHFYLLALPDYLDADLPDIQKKTDVSESEKSRFSEQQQRLLIEHYFAAIQYSRKCHDMLAVFAGKIPHQHGLVTEGVAVSPSADRRLQFLSLLEEVSEFIVDIMLPDTYLLSEVYSDYLNKGSWQYRFISYGLFDSRFGGFFPAGIVNGSERSTVKPGEIEQSIAYSWFDMVDSETRPDPDKPGAYTWVKATRYRSQAYEGGPLARKIVKNNLPPESTPTGVMARLVARSEETAIISKWVREWMMKLPIHGRYIIPLESPVTMQAVQTNDAPRGPLLHSAVVSGKTIDSYNVITPSNWNFSPRDEQGEPGPVEQSLINATVDADNPTEPGRIIRSFDPCLSCATHLFKCQGRKLTIIT